MGELRSEGHGQKTYFSCPYTVGIFTCATFILEEKVGCTCIFLPYLRQQGVQACSLALHEETCDSSILLVPVVHSEPAGWQ